MRELNWILCICVHSRKKKISLVCITQKRKKKVCDFEGYVSIKMCVR